MSQIYDDVQFWLIALTESQRTVICSPELESRLKTQVDARGLGAVLTVVPSRMCPAGCVYVMDENAIDAVGREALQNWRWQS